MKLASKGFVRWKDIGSEVKLPNISLEKLDTRHAHHMTMSIKLNYNITCSICICYIVERGDC